MIDVDQQLPEGWALSTIGEVTIAKVPQEYPRGTFIYIDISSVDNSTKQIEAPKHLATGDKIPSRAKQLVQPGDVLVALTRPNLNAVAKVPGVMKDAIASTGFDVLRPIEVQTDWLLSIVKSRDFIDKMSELVQGALYPAVRPDDIRSYPLLVPPIAEQRRIVEKLHTLQERISNARQAILEVGPLLGRYRHGILEAAFGGRLTAGWRVAQRSTETGIELLHRARDERRRSWERHEIAAYEASERQPPRSWKRAYKKPEPLTHRELKQLPSLPKTWCWASLAEIHSAVEPLCYGVVQPGPDAEDGVPLVRVGDLENGRIKTQRLRRISEEVDDRYRRCRLKGGEILVSVVGTIGITAIVEETLAGANIARAIARVTPVDSVPPEWIAWALASPAIKARLLRGSREVARKTLNLNILARTPIPLAPASEMEKVIALLREQFEVARAAEAEIDAAFPELHRLDQSILSMAFRGDLAPREAELARRERREYESGLTLLRRIAAARKAELDATTKKAEDQKMPTSRKKPDRSRKSLAEVLMQSENPLTPEQLFNAAGFDEGTIDEFYSELREAVRSGRIHESRPNHKDAYLEAGKS